MIGNIQRITRIGGNFSPVAGIVIFFKSHNKLQAVFKEALTNCHSERG